MYSNLVQHMILQLYSLHSTTNSYQIQNIISIISISLRIHDDYVLVYESSYMDFKGEMLWFFPEKKYILIPIFIKSKYSVQAEDIKNYSESRFFPLLIVLNFESYSWMVAILASLWIYICESPSICFWMNAEGSFSC